MPNVGAEDGHDPGEERLHRPPRTPVSTGDQPPRWQKRPALAVHSSGRRGAAGSGPRRGAAPSS
eukprot:5995417-Prorocentrum_lima.AAC.1